MIYQEILSQHAMNSVSIACGDLKAVGLSGLQIDETLPRATRNIHIVSVKLRVNRYHVQCTVHNDHGTLSINNSLYVVLTDALTYDVFENPNPAFCGDLFNPSINHCEAFIIILPS